MYMSNGKLISRFFHAHAHEYGACHGACAAPCLTCTMLPTLGTCHPDLEATNTQLIDTAGASDTTVAKVKHQAKDNTQALRAAEEEHDATVKDVGAISMPIEDTAACLADVFTPAPGKASDSTPTSGARSQCTELKDIEGGKVHGPGTGVGAARYYSCDKGPCRAIYIVFVF